MVDLPKPHGGNTGGKYVRTERLHDPVLPAKVETRGPYMVATNAYFYDDDVMVSILVQTVEGWTILDLSPEYLINVAESIKKNWKGRPLQT
jgi:hypothetical protein